MPRHVFVYYVIRSGVSHPIASLLGFIVVLDSWEVVHAVCFHTLLIIILCLEHYDIKWWWTSSGQELCGVSIVRNCCHYPML